MKKAGIRTWIEPIDDAHGADRVAVISFCEYASWRGWHAASFFLITKCKKYSWAERQAALEAGEQHFREQLAKRHAGHLPLILDEDDAEWRRR